MPSDKGSCIVDKGGGRRGRLMLNMYAFVACCVGQQGI